MRVFGMQITIPACLLVDTSFNILHLLKGHYRLHWIRLFTLTPYFSQPTGDILRFLTCPLVRSALSLPASMRLEDIISFLEVEDGSILGRKGNWTWSVALVPKFPSQQHRQEGHPGFGKVTDCNPNQRKLGVLPRLWWPQCVSLARALLRKCQVDMMGCDSQGSLLKRCALKKYFKTSAQH